MATSGADSCVHEAAISSHRDSVVARTLQYVTTDLMFGEYVQVKLQVMAITAFSILLFTECRMPSGFFLKEKPPCTMPEMSTSESKAL